MSATREIVAALSVAGLIAVAAAPPPASAMHGAPRPAPPDSVARSVIAAEMRAFYRDLDHRDWSALLGHFLPAKVTARWTPPETDAAWRALEAPVSNSSDMVALGCPPRLAMAIVGRWARVRARRCGGPVDEAWLLHVSGRWKIVHLVLGTTMT